MEGSKRSDSSYRIDTASPCELHMGNSRWAGVESAGGMHQIVCCIVDAGNVDRLVFDNRMIDSHTIES